VTVEGEADTTTGANARSLYAWLPQGFAQSRGESTPMGKGCSDPRCSGFDRKRVYKRIEKHGWQAIQLIDEHQPTVYTVGLYHTKFVPELIAATQPGGDLDSLALLVRAAGSTSGR
jgi:hypothetical protein